MEKRRCSIVETLEIVEADIEAYNSLKAFHYRGDAMGPYKKIFAVKDRRKRKAGYFGEFVGVIIYGMPSVNQQLRNIATGNRYRFAGDKRASLDAINRDIRCITRVIIEPRFRGLGVASWLVRETLTRADVPIVEAVAVMGSVNPFFEKAGMQKFEAPLQQRCVRIQQALSMVGLEGNILLDPHEVNKRIENMNTLMQSFILVEMQKFLQAYGSGARIREGIDRTKYVLSRLTARPAYYFWERHKGNEKL
jgi:GNAT superfamily N-acetyltransferase